MRKFMLIMMLLPSILLAEDPVLKFFGVANPEKDKAAQAKIIADDCKTPKATAETFFLGDSKKRLKCFQKSNYSSGELTILSERLQSVFRARGIDIDPKTMPDDENYQDPRSKEHRYTFSRELKQIYIEKSDTGWLFPTEVIAAIDGLYAKDSWLNLIPIYEKLPQWATDDLWGIEHFSIAQIATLLLLIVIGLGLRLLVAFLISREIGKFFLRHNMNEFEILTKKSSYPLGNIGMAAFIWFFVPGLDLNVNVTNYLLLALRIGIGISVVVLAYRSINVVAYFMMQRALKTESKLDDQLVPLFSRGVKIIICIVGAIFVLQNLNVDVTSLLAGLTIGGLAFSFAAKDAVANLFGSITIFADKPFLIGDLIKIGDVEGTVESVGFRSTRIRTVHNSLVSIPNSKFTDCAVDNINARQFRRTVTEIGISYNTDPDQIEFFCDGIRKIISNHPATRKDLFDVHLGAYTDTALKVLISFFVIAPSLSEELRARHQIFIEILRLAKKIDIRHSVPTQHLHIEASTAAAIATAAATALPTTPPPTIPSKS